MKDILGRTLLYSCSVNQLFCMAQHLQSLISTLKIGPILYDGAMLLQHSSHFSHDLFHSDEAEELATLLKWEVQFFDLDSFKMFCLLPALFSAPSMHFCWTTHFVMHLLNVKFCTWMFLLFLKAWLIGQRPKALTCDSWCEATYTARMRGQFSGYRINNMIYYL